MRPKGPLAIAALQLSPLFFSHILKIYSSILINVNEKICAFNFFLSAQRPNGKKILITRIVNIRRIAKTPYSGHTCNDCNDPQTPGEEKHPTSDPILESRHPKVFAEGHSEFMEFFF